VFSVTPPLPKSAGVMKTRPYGASDAHTGTSIPLGVAIAYT
jgi:hypothetical protein